MENRKLGTVLSKAQDTFSAPYFPYGFLESAQRRVVKKVIHIPLLTSFREMLYDKSAIGYLCCRKPRLEELVGPRRCK